MNNKKIIEETNFPVSMWMTSPAFSYQGYKSDSFKVYLLSNNNLECSVDLYARGSSSIPYQPNDNRWYHLNPLWYFMDKNGNKIDSVTLADNVVTSVSGVTGYLLSAEFYYHDDMPVDDISIFATLNVLDYPVYGNNIQFPGYANSKITDEKKIRVVALVPKHLNITIDGVNPLSEFYWKDSKISFIVSVNGNLPPDNHPMLKGYSMGDVDLTLSGAGGNIPIAPDDIKLFSQGGGFIRGEITPRQKCGGALLHASMNGLSGSSRSFEICDRKDFEIRKINENWNAAENLKELARTPHILNNPIFWDKYMASLWGDNSDKNKNGFGNVAYEKIANFLDNHSDVDTCNIDQIYSIAHSLDVPIDDYNINFPPAIKRIMDLMSINLQTLKGDDCKCKYNITNAYDTNKEYMCERCGHYHTGNRGDLFDPREFMVSAYNPFIVKDKATGKYEIIIPPAVGCGCTCDPGIIGCGVIADPLFPTSCDFIIGMPWEPDMRQNADDFASKDVCGVEPTEICKKLTYPLSGYYYILFPDIYDIHENENNFNQLLNYYCFYEYIPTTPCDTQVKGIIDWGNEFTTISKDVTSLNDWYGENMILEKIINHTLREGLGILD